MTSISDRIGQVVNHVFQKIKDEERQLPVALRIPNGQVDVGASLAEPFLPEQHYFQVRVNELYLTKSREWTSVIDPAVLVVSEFSYNGQRERVPVLVGPAMVENALQQVPNGMLFYDTLVAGPHPYRGGALTLAVVLCAARREDYARKMLQLVEGAARALSAAAQIGTYLKVADVVFGGIDLLMGQDSLVPRVGLRLELSPDGSVPLTPGFFVLIDPPDEGAPIDTAKLWVREGRLFYGPTLAEARPFREGDYVLYSITRSQERSPISELPFYPIYQQMMGLASNPEKKEDAKRAFFELQATLVASPDLTRTHRNALVAGYLEELKAQVAIAEGMATMGATPEPTPEEAEAQAEQEALAANTLAVLNL